MDVTIAGAGLGGLCAAAGLRRAGVRVRVIERDTSLVRLLALLIQDYDRRHALPDKSTPAELLQFLVEHSGKSASELLTPVFGTRSHVSEALSGKRPISAEQARKLGSLFRVQPGIFI